MTDATGAVDGGATGLWHRLRYTPLRDVVRGRITARLDLEHKVAAAGLPETVATTVRETVKRVGLSRVERMDVADELIAHFRDGLDAGAAPDALVESFGEMPVVARLIRRAKKRQRPLAWQAVVRSVQLCGLVLAAIVLAYVVSAAAYFLADPAPAVDYRPMINEAALAVPEADRAWPEYRAALLELDALPDFSERFNRRPRPGEQGWSETESYLAAHAKPLERLRRAASMPGLGFPLGREFTAADRELWPEVEFSERDIEEGGLYAVLLPHLGKLRSATRALRLDGLRAAGVGDTASLLADLDAIFGIALHVRETPFIINDLVSLAIAASGFELINDVIDHWPEALDEPALKALAHRVAAFDDETLGVRFDGERIGFRDIVQRIYSDDGEGDGRLTNEGVQLLHRLSVAPARGDVSDAALMALGPALHAIMLSRREALDEYDRLIGAIEAWGATPMWRRDGSAVEAQLEQWGGSLYDELRHLPLVTLTPALSRTVVTADLTRQRRDATLAVIAMELFRRRNGGWPPSLESLTPALMPSVPVDRFNGESLHYAIVDDRPVVYSVGTDRKDDGGRPGDMAHDWRPMSAVRAIEAARNGDFFPQGDWVFWPVQVDPLIDYAQATPTVE